MSIFIIIGLVAGATIGALFGYTYRSSVASKHIGSAETKAKKLITDAELKHKQKILEAEEKAIQILSGAKKEFEETRQELKTQHAKLEKKETNLDNKTATLEQKAKQVETQTKNLEAAKTEIQKIKEEQMAKLEKVAGLTQTEAKDVLFNFIQKNRAEDLVIRLKKLEEQETEEIEAKAKQMLSTVIARCASNHSVETTTTNVSLPNDEMKGRIIGKEGRNIKTLEQLTGVEVLVDDTPGMITISGFSPIR